MILFAAFYLEKMSHYAQQYCWEGRVVGVSFWGPQKIIVHANIQGFWNIQGPLVFLLQWPN